MSREQEIKNIRIEKVKKLKELGMNPYVDPGSIKRDLSLKDVNGGFKNLEKSGDTRSIVGRIMAKRGSGKIMFSKIFDGTDSFQIVFKADEIGPDKIKLYEKLFDIGDFAEFSGTFFLTQKGQPSLLVKEFRMLTKSLLPLPEKWHGLQDVEEKYRKRYLDVLMDDEVFQRFILRTKIIKEFRKVLDADGFLEIETPILQNQASGAMAKTFNTYHNDYDMDMVLRIACEAEHKMIMAGGYQGVYEFSKDFRNEGSDPTHIQEFTQLEWYKAYEGLEKNIELIEKIFRQIFKDILKKEVFEIPNADGEIVKVDFSGQWPKIKFNDLIKQYANIDPFVSSREELEEKAVELGENPNEVKQLSLGNLLDSIYKKSARKNIINPVWVTNYPGSLKPLAIQNDDGTAEATQLVVAGAEITNSYAELVDPITQRKLLEEQAQAKVDGDDEAMDMNNDFLTAMEHGMPPMMGTGIGIDRLVGIFTEKKNIRDTIFFPIMKPKK